MYGMYVKTSSYLPSHTPFSFRQLVFPFTQDPIYKGTLLSVFCDLVTSEQLPECCYLVYFWPSEFKKYNTLSVSSSSSSSNDRDNSSIIICEQNR